MATWKDVQQLATSMPGVDEVNPHDWRVKNKMVIWERPLRQADRDALGDAAPTGAIIGARVPDEGVKHALIADNPQVYFTTPHFNGYPAVLARLSRIKRAELRELIEEAWLDRAPKTLVKQFLATRT